MHEASVAQSIIDIVRSWRDGRDDEPRIAAVFVRIGKLTCVVPDNLRFMFSALTESTDLEQVMLNIEVVPVRSVCRSCGAGFDVTEPRFICGACGSEDVEIVSGEELTVDAVEVI
jgi:hydrogenase nickel incorporation protein HypA/HybF